MTRLENCAAKLEVELRLWKNVSSNCLPCSVAGFGRLILSVQPLGAPASFTASSPSAARPR